MNLNVDKIYVCHYSKLTERKLFVLKQLKKYNLLNYTFVELFDKNDLHKKEVCDVFLKINLANMTPGEKSLALKHAWIVNDIYVNGYDCSLVLEDDVVFCDNFVNKFNDYKKQLPKNWDIGWVGSCFHLKEPEIPGINVYKTNRGSRCTHAFCLSKQFAIKMHKEFLNIDKPSDFYYNHIVKTHNIENYWFQPPLAFQSLEFCSALNADPNHKWDPKAMG